MRKISKPFRSHLLSKHPTNCPCDCSTCVAGDCRPEAVDIPWLHSHFLYPKKPLLRGSERSYYPWKCVELKCDQSILFHALLKRFIISCKLFSGWVFISDNTSHSNNHVNHYLQQIHEHYDAYYVQNNFGHISVFTVWQITVLNSSNPDTNWAGVCFKSTR